MTGWAINKETKNLEVVYKVLRYIHTNTYKEVLGNFPVAPSAYQSANDGYHAALQNTGCQDLATGLEYMLTADIKLPIHFLDIWGAKASSFLDADWNKFLTGELSVSDIQRRIIDNINSVIR